MSKEYEKSYQAAFFVVPYRIMSIDGIPLSAIRVYGEIFQFWNHEKPCYLSNEALMERTGIASESTIREAFIFLEKHNELERRVINGKRYFIQPERRVEIIEQKKPKAQTVDNFKVPVDLATPPRRHTDGTPVDLATHNIKNINKEVEEREGSLSIKEINELRNNNLLTSEDILDLLNSEKFIQKAKERGADLLTELKSFISKKHSFVWTEQGVYSWISRAYSTQNSQNKFRSASNETKCTLDFYKPEFAPTKPWGPGDRGYDLLHLQSRK